VLSFNNNRVIGTDYNRLRPHLCPVIPHACTIASVRRFPKVPHRLIVCIPFAGAFQRPLTAHAEARWSAVVQPAISTFQRHGTQHLLHCRSPSSFYLVPVCRQLQRAYYLDFARSRQQWSTAGRPRRTAQTRPDEPNRQANWGAQRTPARSSAGGRPQCMHIPAWKKKAVPPCNLTDANLSSVCSSVQDDAKRAQGCTCSPALTSATRRQRRA
jgi:hypothetical protein